MTRHVSSTYKSVLLAAMAITITITMIAVTTGEILAANAADSGSVSSAAGAEVIRLDKALDALIAPGTQVEKVAGGFQFTEGPMWREGRLWISDVVGDKIFAVSPTGKVDLLVDKAGGYKDPPPGKYLGPNAMVTDKDGSVLLAQQGGRTLMRITDPLHNGQLKLSLFLDTFEGRKFNSPNDLVFAPDGPLLIAFPDGSGPGVPDGMKVDTVGNIWSTAPGGIRIVAPDGKVLGQIKLPETAANLAWADGGKRLYITAQTSVYRLKIVTAGKMPLYQK